MMSPGYLYVLYSVSPCSLKSVIKADPSIDRAHFHLGLIYFKMKKFDRSRVYLETTLELNSTHKDAAILLGYIHYTLKSYGNVVSTLSMFSKNDLLVNNYYDMIALLGNSYTSLDWDDKAQEFYYDVLQKDIENLSALNGLGDCICSVVACCAWVIVDICNSTGALRAKQSRMEEAVDYFERVLQLDSKNKIALGYLQQLKI